MELYILCLGFKFAIQIYIKKMSLYIVVLLVLAYMISKRFLKTLKIARIYDKYVFITGCDSGFGNLLAKRLDYRGMNVFAGCLTEEGRDKLDRSTSCRVTPLLIDITDEESIKNACMFVKSRLPHGRGLHGLVNNAGISDSISLLISEWIPIDDYKRLLDVNLYGMVRVTNRFLPLIRQERGRIVNMSSVLGRLFAAGGAPYVCSKFAVEGYSDTLRQEYYTAGVKVSIIEPSAFKTNVFDTDKAKEKLCEYFKRQDEDVIEYYGKDYPEIIIKNMMGEGVFSKRLYQVVDAYEHALTSKFPEGRYLVGKDSHTYIRFLYFAPEWLTAKIIGTLNWPLPKGQR
ncbi:dehydrogenase/reductase SDR family member 9-like isoform X1 [Pecten maximus]|uniref:dehydrogenase/reductase SDR family member 9-like isoform X1 n=1 Tax=Pecten maximus TaxID=6579 RepID=UPI0014589EAD|nr:dehydrogenase/reductase SDR family member 9-like isoform X1 [Pecten maximus]